MTLLSVVIITFNEEHNIARCLNSVKEIADEIFILDGFSNDKTVEIAKSKGAKVVQQHFMGFIQQKNAALNYASHNYVLCLDADEALEQSAVKSILEAKNNNFSDNIYSLNRCTNYCGRFIKHGSWYPDRKIRLFNKVNAIWGGINPHDKIIIIGNNTTVKHLNGDILHFSYNSIEEHVLKNNKYSSISAEALFKLGIKSSWIKILIKPFWSFILGYIFRFGFLDGFYGFIIAINSAHTTFQKYIKLYRLQHI